MDDKDLETLMIQSQSGNNTAYEKLLTEVSIILKPFIMNKISNSNDHDDIQQTILIAIHKASHTYQRGRSFRTWMFAIAKHKMTDYLRKSYRDNNKISTELSESISTQSFTQSVDRKFELSRLLSSLPNYQKDLLRLKKDGYSLKELGHYFRKSPSSIKVTIHRAIERLKIQNRRIK